MTIPCRVLMIYPKFVPNSFWNYTEACELLGAKYPAAPLGLITVAAMLPKHWDIRLVNRNTEPLTKADLDWADLVMIGGMLNQQPDAIYLIDLAHLHGKPVCVGGPDVTSSPHLYADADFKVLGEAELVIEDFIAVWESGERKGVFVAEKFKADVTLSPMPRYDLVNFDHYLFMGVQYSRGCPFTCEFCDIIELYGRVPRTKTNDQILAELQVLYDHGYRGHVDFVDDNFIGNKKNLAPCCHGSKPGWKSVTTRSSSRPKRRSTSRTTGADLLGPAPVPLCEENHNARRCCISPLTKSSKGVSRNVKAPVPSG